MNGKNQEIERPKPVAYLYAAIATHVLLCVVLKDGSEIHDCILKAISHDDLLLDTVDGDVYINRDEVRLIRGETKRDQQILEVPRA